MVYMAPPPPAPPAPVPATANRGLTRVWAMVVGLAALGLAFNNVLALVFNLDERRYQADIAAGKYVDPAAVHTVLGNIKWTSTVSKILFVVWAAAAIIWSAKRHRTGELTTRLREPMLWLVSWVFAIASVACNFGANGIATGASTHGEAATYRGWVAAGDGVRAVFWSCCVLLAVRFAFSGRVVVTPPQQRDDLPGGLGDVRARAEHSSNAGTA
jgi:hypothetical protein